MHEVFAPSSATAPMQKQWGIYFGRLQRFISRDYNAEHNLAGQVLRRRDASSIRLDVWTPPPNGLLRPSFHQAINATFSPTSVGTEFGPSWSTHWFRVTVECPPGWQSECDAVQVHWRTEGEGLVWTADGRPVHGLSPQDRTHFALDLVAPNSKALLVSGAKIVFYIELACNGLFGNGVGGLINAPDEDRRFKVQECELRMVDGRAQQLLYDMQVMEGLAGSLGEGNPVGKEILFAANQVINTFARRDLGSVAETITQCQAIADQLLRPAAPLKSSSMLISAVGNCHIDTAWLWRYEETRRKTARSWSSQLVLMERHPEFVFVASQMQQLEWLRLDYPDIFRQIKQRSAEGRFIMVGGSWVEMDGNLPSGESFARHFLYGQKFTFEHFGYYSEVFWLPDTFGYNAQLPQLMSLAGMKYFVTQKLSWNNINRFPHSSFWWEGIDGTRVMTHFPPANTYTSSASVNDVINSDKDCKDRDRTKNAMLLYGHGDGGGGPTEEMISGLKHMAKAPGVPNIKFEGPIDFFHRLEADADKLLTWRGELYLELHRGTYTSQARTKYYNRRCETLLREAEMLSVVNGIVFNKLSSLYPAAELEKLWKDVLLNQFHDVLPGSSIGAVYEDATRLYEHVEYTAATIRDSAMDAIFGNRCAGEKGSAAEESIVFFNTTPYLRDEVLIVPYDGEEQGNGGHNLQPGVLAVANIKGFSMASFETKRISMEGPAAEETPVCIAREKTHFLMENRFLRLHIDQNGHITSMYDKQVGREVIETGGKANRFMMYEDLPFYWDAWDVELYHLEKGWCVSEKNVQISIGMQGPLLASLLRKIQITPDSCITQVISLSCLSTRVDFTCSIDWHEEHKILKVDFPVAVRSDFASYECPFGTVSRPTHMNTSWDMARFEVCGHRFADLSEHDYGVSVLNDCKYGYLVRESLIQLSLLRSPKMPDPECDMGTHVMRFALFPHQGNVTSGRVIEEAVKFNTPLLWTAASHAKYDACWLDSSFIQFVWWRPSSPATAEPSVPLTIEAIKMAEDGSGDVIIRAYEPRGGRGTARLETHSLLKITHVRRCDLLERNLATSSVEDAEGKWHIKFHPYEIISIRAQIELLSGNETLEEPTSAQTTSTFEELSVSSSL